MTGKGGGVKGAGSRGSGTAGAGSGRRMQAERLRSARGRTASSQRWLERQLNDPYVAEARRLGYRSRAAFKLIQLDDRFRLLKPGARVVDLGAAPGGWSQVAAQRCPGGQVVALDILEMEALPGVDFLQLDFLDPVAPERLTAMLGGPAQVVLSDMAAPTIGHAKTDHLRIMGLAEAAYDFAATVLAPGGAFLCKVFQGGSERALLTRLKQDFDQVRHAKPPASRAESAETYVVATGFRGGAAG